MLAAERVALNFLGHLSGVATAAASFVQLIAHTKARVCCTRKTTPGLRALEKYAVRCGGGFNHRFGLDDAILIKDNHIAVAGGIAAVLAARQGGRRPSGQDRDRGRHARSAARGARPPAAPTSRCSTTWTRRRCARRSRLVAGRLVLEASGGITLETAAAIAETGVDYLSSGAITHSAPNLDVALDIEM